VNSKKISNENIIEGCLKGDRICQKELFERFSPKILAVCMRYTDNHDEAYDILQDTFIKVFERIESYKNEGSFEGWLRRISVNTALDYIRRNKMSKFTDDVDDVKFKLSSNEGTLDNMLAEDLMKILNSLPVGYRTVFNMYVIDGYSHKEIAEMLNITESTSKSQFSRARAILQKIIIEKELL
jgi:RNA polymerase sigma factor (sigma-70 family)